MTGRREPWYLDRLRAELERAAAAEDRRERRGALGRVRFPIKPVLAIAAIVAAVVLAIAAFGRRRGRAQRRAGSDAGRDADPRAGKPAGDPQAPRRGLHGQRHDLGDRWDRDAANGLVADHDSRGRRQLRAVVPGQRRRLRAHDHWRIAAPAGVRARRQLRGARAAPGSGQRQVLLKAGC